MEANERIMKFIEYKGISVNAFEKSIGRSTNYIRNSKSFTSNVLATIMNTYPELSIEWLITGEGPMLKQNNLPGGINANYNGTFSEPVGVIVGGGGRIGNDSNPCKSDPVGEEFAKVVNENIKLQMENEHLKMSLKLKEDILREKDAIIGMKNERIEMLIEEKRSKG